MRDSSTTRVAATTESQIDAGARLGSYELVSLIGKGAMGRVYRARHARLGREVAVKVLNAEYVARPDVVERFFREARVVNDIDHEHIVEVTDFVEEPGLAYLVMELLEGESLRQLMKRRRRKYPPLKRIVEIVAQVCEALEAAHEKGVFHRDLKPDNVFVTARGERDFVKVLDFGVAKLRDSVGGDQETSAGVILGTPLYMSPEQALGKEIDRRSDVWSAGVVLFELLAGFVPFTAPSFVELAIQLRERPPKPLPKKTPRGERIPGWLAEVVTRCLEKKPENRYRSMAALGEALHAPERKRAAGFPRRLVAAAAAVAIVAGGGPLAIGAGLHEDAAAALGRGWRSRRRSASAASAAAPVEPAHAPSRTPPASSAPPAREASGAATRTASATPPRPAPRVPAKVELVVRSTPAGATVVRQDTGERLGRTPLRVEVPRKAATVWLKMTLAGYRPVRFTVDLRKDNTANVSFQGAKKAATRRR